MFFVRRVVKRSSALLRAMGIGAAFIVMTLLPLVPSVAADSSATTKENKSDEIVVTAEREKLYKLRAEIVQTEDRFYELFNKLNTNKDFDITCSIDVPTGSKIGRRVCKPKFVLKAQEDEARTAVNNMQQPGGAFVLVANMAITEKMDEYKKHVLAVINQNNQLRKLIREREELDKRYEAARKQKLNGHLFVVE
jgi:hypothetical protein